MTQSQIINPSGRYRMTKAAELMGIGRSTLYKYIGEGKVRTEYVNRIDGTQRQVVKGIEIIRYVRNFKINE